MRSGAWLTVTSRLSELRRDHHASSASLPVQHPAARDPMAARRRPQSSHPETVPGVPRGPRGPHLPRLRRSAQGGALARGGADGPIWRTVIVGDAARVAPAPQMQRPPTGGHSALGVDAGIVSCKHGRMKDTRLVQIRLPKPTALALKIEAAWRDSSMQALMAQAAEEICSDHARTLAARQIELHPADPV